MKPDKVLSMIGLATKAGKTVSGELSVENAVKSHKAGKAALVILAEDASDKTKKHFTEMCTYYETHLLIYGTKETLGHSMGKQQRASLAITDSGFAKTIEKQFNINDN